MTTRLGLLAAVGALLLMPTAQSLAASLAPPPPTPSPEAARLVGTFSLLGTVTTARDIPGERAGRHFLRNWVFTSSCRTGACSTVKLVRQRLNGTDRVSLLRHAPGYYVGTGRFYAPTRCGSRTYSRGVLVPYTLAVRVRAASLFGGVDIATSIRATYTNRTRTNLTPCVAALGHDAASYHGHLVLSPTASRRDPRQMADRSR